MTNSSISEFPYIPANTRSLRQRKPVFGVGINNAPYNISTTIRGKDIRCPFYRTWCNMLERCYSAKLHVRLPTYKDCTVCSNWLSFMTFRSWMSKMDWRGNYLDKDILIPGNKVYSSETCLFVTSQINTLLNDCCAARGAFPQGVCKHRGKYAAQASKGNDKSEYIGLFNTPEEASAAYKAFKSEHIRKVAAEQSEPLKSALHWHAEIIGK